MVKSMRATLDDWLCHEVPRRDEVLRKSLFNTECFVIPALGDERDLPFLLISTTYRSASDLRVRETSVTDVRVSDGEVGAK